MGLLWVESNWLSLCVLADVQIPLISGPYATSRAPWRGQRQGPKPVGQLSSAGCHIQTDGGPCGGMSHLYGGLWGGGCPEDPALLSLLSCCLHRQVDYGTFVLFHLVHYILANKVWEGVYRRWESLSQLVIYVQDTIVWHIPEFQSYDPLNIVCPKVEGVLYKSLHDIFCVFHLV